jgi:hypothetical protein
MAKKRKLNSKNPKWHGKKTELEIIKKVPLTGKAPGYGVWYAKEKS